MSFLTFQLKYFQEDTYKHTVIVPQEYTCDLMPDQSGRKCLKTSEMWLTGLEKCLNKVLETSGGNGSGGV